MRQTAKYRLKYIGDYSHLDDVKTFVSVYEVNDNTMYVVKCPFCGTPMVQTSRNEPNQVLQESYKCDRLHRIVLKSSVLREVGWK